MIPAEAVEAAARVIFDRHHARYEWESVGDEFKGVWKQDARAALEAAAPHMLKSAYDLGFEHGSNEPANPYRAP